MTSWSQSFAQSDIANLDGDLGFTTDNDGTTPLGLVELFNTFATNAVASAAVQAQQGTTLPATDEQRVRALVALNIAAFPDSELPDGVLADVLRGGAAVAKEAGIVIAGGHTVKDKELKYGLSVVGMVHPDRIIENAGAEPGDRLILTKALGTGILTTGLKAEDLDDKDYGTLMESMTRLNSTASEPMESFDVHACTDITGFGLIGHAFEMARGSDAVIELSASDVPLLPGTVRAVEKGYLTGGGATNRRYTEGYVEWKRTKDETLEHILYDPQTSGGLLIAVSEEQSEDLLSKIQKSCVEARIVGRVTDKGKHGIRIV